MPPKLNAALVHVFTALGAVCALLASIALTRHEWVAMFFWLGVAVIVDAVDGPMARAVRVDTVLPRFSGERLDLVIDYLTYVFIPALALWEAGYLQGLPGTMLAGGIVTSSLFHFSDMESKTEDNCFVGFPAVWNVVAFYVFAFDMSLPATAAVVALLIAFTFVPLKWVHPVRVVAFRVPTLCALVLWAFASLWTLWHGFPAPFLAKAMLLGVALYGLGLCLWHGRAQLEDR
jgi:phosphatidylcholine synthase